MVVLPVELKLEAYQIFALHPVLKGHLMEEEVSYSAQYMFVGTVFLAKELLKLVRLGRTFEEDRSIEMA